MKTQVVVMMVVVVLAAFTQVESCVSGSSWHDGCNQCTCYNGHAACTLRYCPKDSYRRRRRDAKPSANYGRFPLGGE